MDKSLDEKAIAGRLLPGEVTSRGFLGTDPRPWTEIVSSDEAELLALGLDFSVIADILDSLLRKAEASQGLVADAGNGLLVSSEEVRGKLPCPWLDGLYHKELVHLSSVSHQVELAFSELTVHLFRVHHFCQGRGSPWRLEPSVLALFFKG